MMGNGAARGEGRARSAAEAAVSSPLLEHVDLADANGILVNVTAGMDMAIGEFEEVGNIVKEFASDEATIVMGTVIDPELQEEMRVTVVATGLNRVVQQGRGRDGFAAYRESSREAGQREAARAPKRPAATLAPVATDYAGLDKPAVQRFARAVGDGVAAGPVDEELLDIPAFLRRQAD
jgi:cell division protein FtsZ